MVEFASNLPPWNPSNYDGLEGLPNTCLVCAHVHLSRKPKMWTNYSLPRRNQTENRYRRLHHQRNHFHDRG